MKTYTVILFSLQLFAVGVTTGIGDFNKTMAALVQLVMFVPFLFQQFDVGIFARVKK